MEVTRADAVERARTALQDHYGKDLHDDELGTVVVQEELVEEYPAAWLVPFASEHFIRTGDLNYALVPSVLLVPKDGSPAHYPPSAIPVVEYLENVASGRTQWLG
ncbi:Immunity protein 35 [Lentzea xinjiangensis]|uniref:Immunity protein 35 n=1 Tax=Lentzea xinjiangensis TaxID=402600 RepID=A0A1H9P4S8_9PSEU|nr:YrhB domain-containing protein [Lentzea xinjiangensis]SER43304.1 Immunity protein 35 [Lentzea xinjiangensis]